MGTKSRTVDDKGFNYMANAGQEEKDRNTCAMLLAVLIMVFLTLSQYLGWY